MRPDKRINTMTKSNSEKAVSMAAGFAAAVFCSVAWLGSGLAVLAVQSGLV
jgi:hypothetical protein